MENKHHEYNKHCCRIKDDDDDYDDDYDYDYDYDGDDWWLVM